MSSDGYLLTNAHVVDEADEITVKLNDKRDSSLWIMNADRSKHRFLARGGNARWSRSGDRVASTADGTPKGSQTFVCYMDAEGAVSQVTHVEEAPGSRRSDLVLQLREPALGDDSLQQRAARHDDDPAIAPAVDDEP